MTERHGRAAQATFLLLLMSVVLFIFPSSGIGADNLIPNPEFQTPGGEGLSPFFWEHGSSSIEAVRKSEFSVGPAGSPPRRALGIRGGEDRAGRWWCIVGGLEKGKRYRLSFMVYREEFTDGAFPEMELFGSRTRMSNLLTIGAWQQFGVVFTARAESTTLKFINDQSETFYFSSPTLVKLPEGEAAGGTKENPGVAYTPLMPDFFPLVAYGAGVEVFGLLKDWGFNGAVVAVNEKNVDAVMEAAAGAGLKLAVNVRDDAAKKLAGSGLVLGWYVEDEPEGRSVPPEEIRDRVKGLRQQGVRQPAFMAMVRPEFVAAYKDAADIILMDQYPVPHNPLIWLSKSMDEARQAGAGDVWAVIQVFGGQGWKGKGWDREPTYEEMKALSYLAVVHGARGLFFYTVKDGNYDLTRDRSHLDDVKRLLRELKLLSTYFRGPVSGTPGFFSDSLYAFAPDGTKPVHAKTFTFGKQKVIVAVNVLEKEVQGRLAGAGSDGAYFDEYFSGRRYVVEGGNISDAFRPHEVKLYIAGKDFKKVKVLDGSTGRVKGDFYAEVAASGFESILGLMFRDLPSEERVLLFPVNEEDGRVWIHALNMKVPFDLLFADSKSAITDLYENVPPCREAGSCTYYSSRAPARTVLELRAGTIRKLQISPGDRVELY